MYLQVKKFEFLTIWLNLGQKGRIAIFGRSMEKIGKSSWWETFRTTFVKLRGKKVSSSKKFEFWTI